VLCPPSVFDDSLNEHTHRTQGDREKELKTEVIKQDVTNKDIKVIIVGAGLVIMLFYTI
jgi:hypothetical protein